MEYSKLKEVWEKYTSAVVLPTTDDRTKTAWTVKLSMLQITPPKMIKSRMIWKQKIPYVSIDYVERALNFVSNFQRGIKITDKWFESSPTSKSVKYQAWVQCDCYIVLDWNRIERSCFGAWTMYENPATSKFNVYEAAKSQATKSFADTLGIWSDAMRSENQAIQKARNEIIETDLDEATEWFTSVTPNE